MEPENIARQIVVERQMLAHIEQALRVALDWELNEDFSRNLSTLRFVAQSFQRHLNRAWALQQHGGYMKVILERRPTLEKEIVALKKGHTALLGTLDDILFSLERATPTDRQNFYDLRDRLLSYLDDLKAQHAQENELYQEAFARDVGGEA